MTLLTTQGLLMRLNAMLCLKAVGKLQSSVSIVFLLCAFLLGFAEPQAWCNFAKCVALSTTVPMEQCSASSTNFPKRHFHFWHSFLSL